MWACGFSFGNVVHFNNVKAEFLIELAGLTDVLDGKAHRKVTKAHRSIT